MKHADTIAAGLTLLFLGSPLLGLEGFVSQASSQPSLPSGAAQMTGGVQSPESSALPSPPLEGVLEDEVVISLAGRVVDPFGQPLSGVKIRAFREAAGDEGEMRWVEEASTDEKGLYAIELPQGAPLLLIFSGPQGYQARIARQMAEEEGGELSLTLPSYLDGSSEQFKREQVKVIEAFLAASKVAPAAEAEEMTAELRVMLDKIDPPVGMAKRVSDISESLTSAGERLSSPAPGLSDSDQEPPKGPGTVWVISDEPPSLQ